MILEHTRGATWLSNSWLIGDRPGGHAVLVDTGGPTVDLERVLEQQRLTLTHVLCTHHHHDHVTHNAHWRGRAGCPVCGGAAEAERFAGLDLALKHGDEIRSGELTIRALAIPGHTAGQLAFLVNERDVFTGDTLFRGTVGGTRAPGHTCFEDLRHSVLEVLLGLPDATRVHPGHMESTSIGREREENPFVRVWRGLDRAEEVPCTAFGEPAALLVEARDYDGGTKCQVRFRDGRLDVVPGSRCERI